MSPWRRNALIGAGVALAATAIGATAFLLTRSEEPAPSTTTTTTTTTASTTSVPPEATGPIAPLTGLVVPDTDPEAVARLQRPALAAKIDNAPQAMPQVGLDRADIVIELRVEGISRFIAVVHSQQVDELGPIRSARTSDPDLLAMFVRPLFAWSGGNPKVIGQIRSTPWIQSLNPDQVRGAYSRSSAKRAPHNLIADVERLYRAADEPPALPVPVVGYLTRDADPGGAPVPGLSVSVGASSSTYVWDADAERWFRWAGSTPQRVRGGEQVSAANVVVLATPYTASSADPRSPEAQTLGSGSAWVFTGGRVVEGRWERAEPASPWRLTRDDGSPILLTPGVTWVALPSPDDPPRPLSTAAAERLLDQRDD
jgi:hypothetical protein